VIPLDGSEEWDMFKLPKRRILRKKKDFQTVYRYGRSYANRYLVLYVFQTKEHSGQVGFAAGKKLGNAVVRNRVKRLLRESYRLNQNCIRDGVALLMVGRHALVDEKCGVAQKAFLSLGRKAGIFTREEGK